MRSQERDEILRAAKRAASLTAQLLPSAGNRRLTPEVLDLNHIVSTSKDAQAGDRGRHPTRRRLDPQLDGLKADPSPARTS